MWETNVAIKNSGWTSKGITKPLHMRGMLIDDGWLQLPNAVGGCGFITADAGTDFCMFSYNSTGDVVLEVNESTWKNSDTDGYYCLYDNGTQVILKNRKGSTKDFLIVIWPM